MVFSGTATIPDADTLEENIMTIHSKHRDFLEKRDLDPDFAEMFGVTTTNRQDGAWLTFPYRLRGEVVNRKYRLTSEKRHMMDQGGKLCLWNAEVLREKEVCEGGTLIITEGEFDALAALQAGFRGVVSVPNGAPGEQIDDPENSNRYAFLWEHKEDLDRVDKFILATDGDAPGRAMAQDLISLLGAERCWFIEYPEGCKDLNDILQVYSESSLVTVIEAAKPVPVQGLFRVSEFPEMPKPQGHTIGIEPIDRMLKMVFPSLTVLTGYANVGKSTIIDSLIASQIVAGRTVCLAAFESLVKPGLVDAVARCLLKCGESELATHEHRKWAFDLIEKHLLILANDVDEDLEFDLSTFMETVRIAVLREGAKVVIIDPWNELEHKRESGESETEYSGRALRTIKKFIKRHNLGFWIAAHPTKPIKGVNAPPSLYDISGSAHWANKPDYGLVYHRKDKSKNDGELIVAKVRKDYPGYCGSKRVRYDLFTSNFVEFEDAA